MKDNQQILGTEPIGKLLIKYSVPAIIGMIVNGLYNVGIWYVNRYRYYNKHIY